MKPSILACLAVGLATGCWMFAEYGLGLHDAPAGAGRWTGFLSLIFPVVGAYWVVAKSPRLGWRHACRQGIAFGLTGGVVGGAAIYLYFAIVNPGFSVDGRPVDASSQAIAGFFGSVFLGTILTASMHAIFRRNGVPNG